MTDIVERLRAEWRCPKCGSHYFTHGIDRGGSPICPPAKGGDIVERLRASISDLASGFWDSPDGRLIAVAADEIERLTTAVNMLLDGTALRDAEIERLRGELANRVEQVARLKKERMWKP